MAATPDWCDDLVKELVEQVPGIERRKPTDVRDRCVEIDVWIDPGSVRQLGLILAKRGFFSLRSVHEGTHRFYLVSQPRGWCKVDAKTRSGKQRTVSNGLWALRRRRGVIIALVGADGAGKSSAIETIHRTAPFGTYIAYLGWRKRKRAAPTGGAVETRQRSRAREVIGVGVWALRTVRRLLPLHLRARLGTVVICDRHPIEIEAVDGTPSAVARSLRRFIAARLIPRPDHIFLLAAPGEILYARKGEHSPQRLDEMTAAFRTMVQRRGGTEIDAQAPPAAVVGAIEDQLATLIAGRM